MKSALFLLPDEWITVSGPDGPSRTLQIWRTAQVGGEFMSGGSIPQLERPPENSLLVLVNCPDARWDIITGDPRWQLLYEYPAGAMAALMMPAAVFACVITRRDMLKTALRRRTLIAMLGLAPAAALAAAGKLGGQVTNDAPMTEAKKEKLKTWSNGQKEKTWTKAKLDTAFAGDKDTERKQARAVAADLFRWSETTLRNCLL